MGDLLPSRPDLSDDDTDPRVVGLDSDEVDDLLAAIASETARNALAALHDDPGAPSEVADRVDTSIQNAQYHLDRLETAGLIEAAGTAYSEKGREMTVYAPSDQALVVVAGSDEEATGLQSALTQLLGGVGAVALGSVVVDRLARTGAAPAPTAERADADGGGGAATNATGTVDPGNPDGRADSDADSGAPARAGRRPGRDGGRDDQRSGGRVGSAFGGGRSFGAPSRSALLSRWGARAAFRHGCSASVARSVGVWRVRGLVKSGFESTSAILHTTWYHVVQGRRRFGSPLPVCLPGY